jgi:predicted aldo/keto reductase-like oxidoreductase
MKRRTFLASVGGAVGAGAIANASPAGDGGTKQAVAPLARRALGRTGVSLPVVGFPALALKNGDQEAADVAIRRSFELGVDYFDVAPAYGRDGECEIKLGIALEGIPRDKYFLACKTQKDDAEGGRLELERSLKRLKTDHFDLFQLHCLQREDEVKQALGPGGVLEMILKAKQEGKVKHIGFSAHTTGAALAALNGFDFDSCMFPINFVEYFKTDFGREVLALAAKKGTSIISIKPVSRGLWPAGVKKTYNWWYRPLEDEEETRMAMNWVLAQPGMVSTLPASYLDVFERTVAAARLMAAPLDEENAKLKDIAATCLPIFKPREEKQELSEFSLPGIPAYPSRRGRV